MHFGPTGSAIEGSDGVGVLNTVDNGDGTFTINYTDGSYFTSGNLTGPAGSPGDSGSSVDIIFQRSLTQPDTPAPSSGIPLHWFTTVSNATGE